MPGGRPALSSSGRAQSLARVEQLGGGRDRDLCPLLAGQPVRQQVLGSGRAVTAVFCANDMLALGVLRRLGQLGVGVPADVAVVGYDDIEFAADGAVPLTSVRQPKYQLGRAAAELLLDEADRPAEHEHRRFVFTPELVVRASSGSSGAAGPADGRHAEPRGAVPA
jgi:LacI family transcriptional regulator